MTSENNYDHAKVSHAKDTWVGLTFAPIGLWILCILCVFIIIPHMQTEAPLPEIGYYLVNGLMIAFSLLLGGYLMQGGLEFRKLWITNKEKWIEHENKQFENMQKILKKHNVGQNIIDAVNQKRTN